MLYFPDNLKNAEFNDIQEKIGTNFIINSIKLKKNIHLKDTKEKNFSTEIQKKNKTRI